MSWDNATQAGCSLEGIGLTGYGTASKKEIMCAAAPPLRTLSTSFLRSRNWSGLRETRVSFPGRRHHLLSQLLSEP